MAILEDIGHLNAQLKSEKNMELAVRIGVHTGLVVAGEMGGGDTVESLAIVGETPNIAARLQEAAEPNSIVISNITANLVQGFFVCDSLGFHQLKGISDAMELLVVLAESGAQTRFDVATAQLTPLVGRDQELGLLLDRWEQVEEGLGQVVLLSGGAGIGKSRLMDSLVERLAKEPHILRRLRCSAYHQNSALHPVLEYLEGWLEFTREDLAEERLGKLEHGLAKVDFPLSEAVPLLSGYFSVPLAERYPAQVMLPEVQLERTRELLVALLLDTPEDQPLFLVVEDLHWADPSTLATLGLLLDQVPTAKVMALLSFRPEFTPPWPSRAYITPVVLNRLTRRLAGEMIGRLTGGKTLPEEVLSQVAAKSDGVPIFVEELTRMLLESDLLHEVGDHYELTGPLTPLAIPATLQDSLTARLDRLSSAREVAQLGVVLGREFTYELINAVSPWDEELLGSHLQGLVNAEFLYQRRLPPDANYTFKHALIQDAAYESLLRSRRQQYHRRTAEVLEEGSADIVETQPELLANHFAEAGLTERAVHYWLSAGQRALVTYAYEEALTHFERGLLARNITLSGTEAATDEEAAALLFGLSRCQAATLERTQRWVAEASMERAFGYYFHSGDVGRAVAVAETPLFTGSGGGIIGRALTLVSPDSYEGGRLSSLQIVPLGETQDNYQGAQEAFDRAITIARREGDSALEMSTLVRAAHFEIASVLYAGGDLVGAVQHAAATKLPAERARMSFWLIQAMTINHIVAACAGDWNTARDFSDQGLAASPRDPTLLAGRTLLEYEVGNFTEGGSYLEGLLAVIQQAGNSSPVRVFSIPALVLPAIDRIAGAPIGTEAADLASKSVLSLSFVLPIDLLPVRVGLALTAVDKSDIVAARDLYAEIQEFRGGLPIRGATVAIDRVLGILSQTIGDLHRATGPFEDALAFCRQGGYRPELAWSCCDYADILLERDNDGDRANAVSLLDESLAISSELGMRPLMERVLSRREILRA